MTRTWQLLGLATIAMDVGFGARHMRWSDLVIKLVLGFGTIYPAYVSLLSISTIHLARCLGRWGALLTRLERWQS